MGSGRAVIDLAGRTALVTGAGNGLGRSMVDHLHRSGVRVILVGRDRSRLDGTVQTLGLTPSSSRVATCDVSDARAVAGLAHEVSDEQVSILVNNAGVPGPVADLTDVAVDDWDDVFATNVRGVYLMCRAFLPSMKEVGSGDIVNLASVSGKRPLAGRTPYCASKMAVLGLTSTLAFEVGPFGIRVNTLSPGPVDGPRMTRNIRLDSERSGVTAEDAHATLVSRAALGRMLREDEVGEALIAMLRMPALTAADIDLSAGMAAR